MIHVSHLLNIYKYKLKVNTIYVANVHWATDSGTTWTNCGRAIDKHCLQSSNNVIDDKRLSFDTL